MLPHTGPRELRRAIGRPANARFGCQWSPSGALRPGRTVSLVLPRLLSCQEESRLVCDWSTLALHSKELLKLRLGQYKHSDGHSALGFRKLHFFGCPNAALEQLEQAPGQKGLCKRTRCLQADGLEVSVPVLPLAAPHLGPHT